MAGQGLGIEQQGLALGHGTWIGGKALKAAEQIAQSLGKAGLPASGRRGALGRRSAGVNLLAEIRLGIFQGLLLRFDIAADTDLRLQLAVQKRAAHLLDRDHVGAGALRTNPGGHGQGTVDVKPLAAVSWIVDVGQILPGDFDTHLLGLQRTGA